MKSCFDRTERLLDDVELRSVAADFPISSCRLYCRLLALREKVRKFFWTSAGAGRKGQADFFLDFCGQKQEK